MAPRVPIAATLVRQELGAEAPASRWRDAKSLFRLALPRGVTATFQYPGLFNSLAAQ